MDYSFFACIIPMPPPNGGWRLKISFQAICGGCQFWTNFRASSSGMGLANQ